MHEVSRRVWGLRLRRTEQELAISPRFMLPSAHYKDVGVRVASFRSSIAHPTYSPVYASSFTSRCSTQNSGPSGSLLLTRENFPFSASCRFIPAHCNGDFSTVRTIDKGYAVTHTKARELSSPGVPDAPVLLHEVIARGAQAASQGQPENVTPVLPKVDLGVRVALNVPIAPTPVPIGDHVDLVYELHLCSYDDRRVILRRVEILADTRQYTLATFENDSLTGSSGTSEPDSDLAAHAIAPRNQIVLYFWIPSHPGSIPSRLSHRLTFDTGSEREIVEGGKIEIATRPPVARGPPLRSGYWVASNSGHDTLDGAPHHNARTEAGDRHPICNRLV